MQESSLFFKIINIEDSLGRNQYRRFAVAKSIGTASSSSDLSIYYALKGYVILNVPHRGFRMPALRAKAII
jgi:hypothetical protein